MFTNGSKPHDQLVQDRVLPFLRKEAPRVLFVGFAETDDWGHEGRYDRFLEAAHAVDRYLEELWSAVQSHPQYRNRTTLIFTADHGRGRAPEAWRHHGRDIDGSDETFIITIGPDVAAGGERKRTRHTLGDVARATAAAVGLTYRAEQLSRRD
jgi:bisphosphoglycerate-independent phosphoglycerate mutase (AlkP superfamily)